MAQMAQQSQTLATNPPETKPTEPANNQKTPKQPPGWSSVSGWRSWMRNHQTTAESVTDYEWWNVERIVNADHTERDRLYCELLNQLTYYELTPGNSDWAYWMIQRTIGLLKLLDEKERSS